MPPPRKPRGRGRPRGSVYWHEGSQRWCAQTPPDSRGRRRSRYFATDDEAWAWLAIQVEALDDGADITAGTERLSAYLRRWLEREQANPDRDWSPSTVRTYTWAVDLVASHRAGRTPIADLTADRADSLLVDLGDGRSRKSVSMVRFLLRSALADLVDDGVLRRNPVRRARPTRHVPAPERCPWTEDDARRFLDAARRWSKRPALWWLLASCGLRSAEARGLSLADVDLPSGTIAVWRSKTRTRQTIDLPTNVVDALRDHLRARKALGGPLFQALPGREMSGKTLLDELRRLRRLAGVPPIGRVHDLRHVAASLMLANGYPIATVAAILGHRSPRTTLEVYAHAVPKHVVRAPRNIADVLPYPGGEEQRANTAPAVQSAVERQAGPPSPAAHLALADR